MYNDSGHLQDRVDYKSFYGYVIVFMGDLETRYINTKLNVSDVFTKDVSHEVIEALGPMLTGRKPWPETPAADDAMKEHLAKALREREWNSTSSYAEDERESEGSARMTY